MKNRLPLTLFLGTLKKEIKYKLRIIFNEMNKTLLKIIKIKFNTKEYELKYLYIYIIKMNITLDLSSAQLRNLRNGKGIRISPAMFGSGVDMIIDPMNYNNLLKKLERGKGAVMSMGNDELEENEIQGTGLFAGAGKKSVKISRIKKARKWRDFSDETLRKGVDTGRYGYEQFKEATDPVGSELKKTGKKAIQGFSKMFGGEMEGEDMEGDGFFKDLKKGYNRKVKNSKLGSALRDSAGMAIGDVYERGAKELGKHKYGKPVSQYMKDTKGSNVKRLTGLTGLGLRVAGDGKMRPAVMKRPSMAELQQIRPAVMTRPTVMPGGKFDPSKLKHGNGLRMSGGACEMCKGSGMNDKFIFADQAL